MRDAQERLWAVFDGSVERVERKQLQIMLETIMQLPILKKYVLPEETLKTRRNLVFLSLSTLAFILLSPQISELKIAGIEVKITPNGNLHILLLLLVTYELITFCIRFYLDYTNNAIDHLNDETTAIKKEIDEYLERVEQVQRSINKDQYRVFLKKSNDRLAAIQEAHNNEKKKITIQFITSELLLPIFISVSAMTMLIRTLAS
ncbi:MAG: hypothetical protein HY916_09670 [Desulfovibrio sp.]|nr:hypothetical protein [Desulfovibrio sp.]